MSTEHPLRVRERLSEVRYEIRCELARRAHALEAAGRTLIKLNIGNPGAFGFRAPAHLQRAIVDNIDLTDPYTHQLGLPAAREALASAYRFLWRLQAGGRLLTDRPLDMAAIGEGGRAFLLRELDLETLDDLRARLLRTTGTVARIVDAALGA